METPELGCFAQLTGAQELRRESRREGQSLQRHGDRKRRAEQASGAARRWVATRAERIGI